MEITKDKSITAYYVISYFVMAVAFVVLCIFLNEKIDMIVNSDMSSDLLYSSISAQQNKFMLTDWYYSTELRVFHTNLVFTPLFQIFSDWHMVRVVGSIIIILIFLACLYLFTNAINLKKLFPIIATLLLIPFSEIYFSYILVNMYYSTYFILELLVLSTLILSVKQENKKARFGLLALSAIFSFVAGLCGARLIINLFLPMALTVFILLIANLKSDKKEYYKKLFISTFIVCVISAIGLIIYMFCLSGKFDLLYKFGSTNSFKITFNVDNILQMIANVIDLSSTNRLIGFMYCLLFIVSFIIIFIKKFKSNEEDKVIAVYTVCSMVAITAISVFTTITVNIQYALLPWIFSIFVIASGFKCIFFNKKIYQYLIAFCVIAIIFLPSSINQYIKFWNRQDNQEKISVMNVILENGAYNGYASFWEANVLTELSDGKISVRHFAPYYYPDNINIDDNYKWLIQKSLLESKPEGKIFVIMAKNEYSYAALTQYFTNFDYVEYETSNYYLFIYDSYEQMVEVTGVDHNF